MSMRRVLQLGSPTLLGEEFNHVVLKTEMDNQGRIVTNVYSSADPARPTIHSGTGQPVPPDTFLGTKDRVWETNSGQRLAGDRPGFDPNFATSEGGLFNTP